MGLRLADVLAVDADRYVARGCVSAASARAYDAILRCHTAALGGHVARCEKGHVVGAFYNSCRHRACPRCGWGLGRRWLERRVRTLLGCAHPSVYYYLYVVLDIFSRYVVGWLLAQHENAGLAQRLIRETCSRQEVEPGQLVLHADRGAPMTSKTLSQMLADLGVEKTHARPHVSDDNPFSESQFKTLKYSPGFPDRFGSPEHARDVTRSLFRWYNHEHHHGALCYLTPAVVHYGRAGLVLAERHRVQLAAFHQHPERFVNGPPKVQRLPEAVWINPPETATRQDAPGSTQTDSDDPRVVPAINTYGLLTRSGAHQPLGEREQAAL